MTDANVTVRRTTADLAPADFDNPVWEIADRIVVSTYWDGAPAPSGRHFEARLLWSVMALYVRFEAEQDEPLVVIDDPDLRSKTMNLWDRDVCEIFIAPQADEPRRYFEFEIAPTGEWLDVAINSTGAERRADWNYRSGMECASRIRPGRISMSIKIPLAALAASPTTGDVWLGNIFRCVGRDPSRGYLAWRPTLTARPNFHVPERFGDFVFVE